MCNCDEKDCLGHDVGEEDFEEEIIVLKDEDGIDHEFEVLGIVDIDEIEYAILYPVEGNEDEDEAIAFRIERDGDEETLVIVEDDDELEKVRLAWEANLGEEE